MTITSGRRKDSSSVISSGLEQSQITAPGLTQSMFNIFPETFEVAVTTRSVSQSSKLGFVVTLTRMLGERAKTSVLNSKSLSARVATNTTSSKTRDTKSA